jgi:hypothetical protein
VRLATAGFLQALTGSAIAVICNLEPTQLNVKHQNPSSNAIPS